LGDWPETQIGEEREGEKLPAVSAIAAVSTITAAPAATTAAISPIAATATTAATITAASTAATGAFRLRASFVDHEVPATKVLTVEAGDGAIGIFITGDFDEREAARLSCKTVTDQTNCRGGDSQLTEPLLQLLF
jgi:hypothetical protein